VLLQNLNRRTFLGSIAAPLLSAADTNSQWVSLFDGHSMNGWKPSEHKGSWSVQNGMLTAKGPRSHLFYDGPVKGADFRNFELEVEVITQPECNSGVYFHTAYQESGFPEKGFEVQINNTAQGEGNYRERKKTGSLYGLRNMYKQLVPDQKPFRIHITVRGKTIQVHLNGQLLVDYVEPTPPIVPAGGESGRYLSRGTFALQCHNDGSFAAYRNVRVRPLPDNLPEYSGKPPVVDATFKQIIDIGRHNVPLVDFHVFLGDGLTLESALSKSRADGIQYGITARSSQWKSPAEATAWLKNLQGRPVFIGLSAEDSNWTKQLSQATAQKFDYVLLDAAALHGGAGVDQAVQQIVDRLDHEPIDILANATYLPGGGKRWTEAQMSKLIDALSRNKIAVELNTTNHLPERRFIELAKAADCKFAYGTGNKGSSDLRRCEYGLEMTESCKLDWKNFYTPGSWYPKAVDRRWSS
jgi:histidinol phosphatase-like PHP family hydrolase